MKPACKHIIGVIIIALSLVSHIRAGEPSWNVVSSEYYKFMYFRVSSIYNIGQLEQGDIIGVFYNYKNERVCGGKMVWGSENYMMVYHDTVIDTDTDLSTTFDFKIWKKSKDCIIYDVEASFDKFPYSPLYNGDSLSVISLAGRYLGSGYTGTEFCDNEGVVSPILLPETGLINYSSDFKRITSTGDINLDGSFFGTFEIKYSSAYCLVLPSQIFTIKPSPRIALPEILRFCEGEDLKALLQSYVYLDDFSGDVKQVSYIGNNNYLVEISNESCVTKKVFNADIIPAPVITSVVTDLCDSVLIELDHNGTELEWSNGIINQQKMNITNDQTIWARVTDDNGCVNTDTFDIKIRKIAITSLETDKVDADCYNGGELIIRSINLINSVGNYRLTLKNLLTNEEFAAENKLREGMYKLSAIDERGCLAQWDTELLILKDCLNDNPVFSPNGDGSEDDYYISTQGTIYIYDKYGRMVNKLEGPLYWDGTDRSGHKLPLGVYLMVTGSEVTTITIIR
jgi:hypothetical protein